MHDSHSGLEPNDSLFSKSQRKRDAHALQELGITLTKLGAAQLAELPLSDELREAIELAQSTRQHGALRRQRQYIGKLLRQIDPQPIQDALAKLEAGNAASQRRQHELEYLREALLVDEQNTLNQLLTRYPRTDRQYLRQLIRKARRERQQGETSQHGRALFRYLRELLESAAMPDQPLS